MLLFALIFRAVSLEFRSKLDGARWRGAWDAAFFAGEPAGALLFGVAVGNVILGMPLDERGVYHGRVLDLLNPYPLLVGVLARRALRDARAHLPVPEDRRASAGAAGAVDVAHVGRSSWCCTC